MTHVLYLHGFLSSPQSAKAQETVSYFKRHFPDITLHVPQLSNSPSNVAAQLMELLKRLPALTENGVKVIGSSMGGYLATWLVEKFGGRAVLINPAVKPYELLQDFLGQHTNPYTGEVFTLVEDDMAFLVDMDTATVNQPGAYRVMLQTGDETLDYRQAQHKYAASALVVEEGGDHSFVDYQRHLPEIAQFLLA